MVALDTLSMCKRLKEAGFTETQAKAVTLVLRDTRAFDFSQLSTKADLALLRAELEAKIEAVKAEMIEWVVGIGFAQVATILPVLRLFPSIHP